jgi:hypothetical protein
MAKCEQSSYCLSNNISRQIVTQFLVSQMETAQAEVNTGQVLSRSGEAGCKKSAFLVVGMRQ